MDASSSQPVSPFQVPKSKRGEEEGIINSSAAAAKRTAYLREILLVIGNRRILVFWDSDSDSYRQYPSLMNHVTNHDSYRLRDFTIREFYGIQIRIHENSEYLGFMIHLKNHDSRIVYSLVGSNCDTVTAPILILETTTLYAQFIFHCKNASANACSTKQYLIIWASNWCIYFLKPRGPF